MALRPDIILQGRGADFGGQISGALSNAQSIQNLRQTPIRNQLLEQAATRGEQQIQTGEQDFQVEQRNTLRVALQAIKPSVDSGDMAGAGRILQSLGLPPEFEQGILERLQGNPADARQELDNTLSALQSTGNRGLASAKTKQFDNGTVQTVGPDNSIRVFAPNQKEVFGEEAAETLKTARIEQIDFAGAKAEATAGGKATGEAGKSGIVAKAKAEIATAVKLATSEATARGETITDLKRISASLPGLISVVGQLKELAPIVTSTIGGRFFDLAVKETGFGATKGATAKAKFVSIINNQILPLLKQTFGAAFTKPEGDELKATMGDPDSSPEEKLVQLDAFIEGKFREIQTKERELGQVITPAEDLRGRGDTGITIEQFRDMTPEQRAAEIQKLQVK